MAIDLSRPQADVSVYVNDARGVSPLPPARFPRFHRQRRHHYFFRRISRALRIQNAVGRRARKTGSRCGSFLMKVDTQAGPRSA